MERLIMGMNINEMKVLVKKLLKTNRVPALRGVKGIGKTEAIKQIADELGIGYQAIYASSLEGADFMGLVVKDLDAGVTRYLAPEFLPTDKAVEKGLFPQEGILVLEEFNRADTQTIHALYPLLLEKKINNHKIAEGWKILVAMNPDNMKYTTNSLDNAALDRITIIDLEANFDVFAKYMIESGKANDSVMYFLAEYKELFCVDELTDNMEKSPSPRGWSAVSEIFNTCELSEKEKRIILEGEVGSSACASFIGFLNDKDVRKPAAEDILNKFNTSIKKDLATLYDKKRYDLLTFISNAVTILYDNENETHKENIMKYFECLPEELALPFYHSVKKNMDNDQYNKFLKDVPKFGKIVMKVLVENQVSN